MPLSLWFWESGSCSTFHTAYNDTRSCIKLQSRPIEWLCKPQWKGLHEEDVGPKDSLSLNIYTNGEMTNSLMFQHSELLVNCYCNQRLMRYERGARMSMNYYSVIIPTLWDWVPKNWRIEEVDCESSWFKRKDLSGHPSVPSEGLLEDMNELQIVLIVTITETNQIIYTTTGVITEILGC